MKLIPAAVIVVLLASLHLFIEPMWMTGDEPRYASHALGLYSRGALRPDAATWRAFVGKSDLPPRPYPNALVDGHPPRMHRARVGAISRRSKTASRSRALRVS